MNAARYILNGDIEGARPALLTSAGTFTHGDIQRGAASVLELLAACGFGKGDFLVLLDHSSYFWTCAYLGSMAAGAVAVPLPTTIEKEQLHRILSSTGAKGVFMGAESFKRYGALLSDETKIFTDMPVAGERRVHQLHVGGGGLAGIQGNIDSVEVDEARDMAALMFTSGSTGIPRGVMVSHRNIIANTESIVEYLGLTAEDRIMAFLPFYYCFGTSLLHTHLRVGGSLAVENSFLFPSRILKRMVETGCTGMAGVPSHYQILLRKSPLKEMSFPALRYVQQAGGRLHDAYLEELQQALPGKKIFVMYGQTEATARLSFLPPELLERKKGSIGKGMPGTTLEVVNAEGRQVQPGEVGEIVARGDNITLGYWKDPEATEATFRQGRLFTGDLATVDEDGFIYVVERAKDFIKCGGNRVGCRQIEEVVVRFPNTVEAAVLPQFDEALGEAVCLCVVHPSGEAVREDLLRYCGRSLPWDQVPRAIHFLEELPRQCSGKVDKQVLKNLYGRKNVLDATEDTHPRAQEDSP